MLWQERRTPHPKPWASRVEGLKRTIDRLRPEASGSSFRLGLVDVLSLITAAVGHKFHPYLLHPRKRLGSDLQKSSVVPVDLWTSTLQALEAWDRAVLEPRSSKPRLFDLGVH